MNIIIITSNELRHQYFRLFLSNHSNINVIASYCEGIEESLENRVKRNLKSSQLELQHVDSRNKSEEDYFREFIKTNKDFSNPKFITKGRINDESIVSEIIGTNADLLICYGSSIIKSSLLNFYKGRFLNVHLGLSPYYRGSGTNIWPLINGDPSMVGATFMHMNEGIDTGEIIHQIRADIFLGDSPHNIGNRLIKKMTKVYSEIILKFLKLKKVKQPVNKGLFYKQKDFDGEACRKLYDQFNHGMIEKFLNSKKSNLYTVRNPGLMI